LVKLGVVKKKILITGANGYIGARLAIELSNRYDVYAHCYPKIPPNKSWISKMAKVFTADLRDISAIEELSDLKVNTLIHLVSLDHHQSKDEPVKAMSVNVNPVWSLLDAFSKKNYLKQFIYFSTIHVYGNITEGLINESYPTNPSNEYALTHLMAEQIVNYFNQTTTIDGINVRLSNSYGPPVFEENNCWWLVINDLCKTAIENQKIVLNTDGSPMRDFIHSSDLVLAIKLLIDKREKQSDRNLFHLSSGKTLSILQLALKVREIFSKTYNRDIPLFINENEVFNENNFENTKKEKYTISNEKIKKLGFRPKTNLEKGILDTFGYLTKNTQ